MKKKGTTGGVEDEDERRMRWMRRSGGEEMRGQKRRVRKVNQEGINNQPKTKTI